MSATQNKVLISGVTGFVGAWTALSFLQHGWTVRGTVRSQQKADTLAALPAFKDYAAKGQLEFAIVEDVITGDFGPALKGIQYFAHTASPFSVSGTDNKKDFLDPAIKGTENAIKAAHKAGVKHFVVTSSFAAILPATAMQDGYPFTNTTYTEKDWNDTTYDQAAASDMAVIGYVASKALAEKTAWEYQKKNNLQDSLKISTICPPMIFGPFVHLDSSKSLGESLGQIRDLVTGKHGSDIPPAGFPHFVDVRDVAEAHYEAINKQATGRFAISKGVFDNQLILDVVHKDFPEQAKKFNLPVGQKGKYIWQGEKADKFSSLSGDKSRKELGLTYPHSTEDTIRDSVKDIYDHLD